MTNIRNGKKGSTWCNSASSRRSSKAECENSYTAWKCTSSACPANSRIVRKCYHTGNDECLSRDATICPYIDHDDDDDYDGDDDDGDDDDGDDDDGDDNNGIDDD